MCADQWPHHASKPMEGISPFALCWPKLHLVVMKSTVCNQLEIDLPKENCPNSHDARRQERIFVREKNWQTNGWSQCDLVQPVHTQDPFGTEEEANVSPHFNNVM